MELTTIAVRKWDAETIKDRVVLAIIGFSGLLTVAWCATLAGVAVSLIAQVW